MGDYHSERYRRDNPWRADENRRDDDLGDPWDDGRGSRWADQDEWQPESYGDSWDTARRRQRLTPGQLSEGGPAPSGYRGDDDNRYGQRDRNASRDASNYRGDLRYGLNGGEASSPDDEQDWRMREQYRSRQYASEYGDYGDLGDARGNRENRGRDSRFGGRSGSSAYGRERGDAYGRYAGGERAGGFGNADQAWLRDADRREPGSGYGGQYGDRHNAYFNDLRSDTRYWTEPRDEWGGDRPPYYAQSYGRDYPGGRGYDEELGDSASRRWTSSTDTWRDDDSREHRDDEHGALYNLGHRIGQAFSEWFGPDAMDKRSAPRGYTRTDERIRDEICERLTFASGVDVQDVTVDVDKGKVTLGGTVSRRSQKYDIEDLADNTFGVSEVENNIRVQRPDVDSAATSAGGFNGW